jgi:DNA-binding LytR/AlgR family response regulator
MTKKLRVLFADDEPLMRERMQEILELHSQHLEIVGQAVNGRDALEQFEKHKPDVVFLDIRMPVLSGLDVATEIGDRARIVFCTAYDQHAISAFERGAVDYLLKPIEEDRMQVTVDRLLHVREDAPDDVTAVVHAVNNPPQTKESEPLRWIKAGVGNDVKMFSVEQVIFFQSDTKYTRVVTATDDVVIRTPLKELLDGLDPNVFWQVHRSVIVNIHCIERIQREGPERHSLILRGTQEQLKVSRHFAHLFKQM